METVYQHGEPIQRSGIDGTALVKTGEKGDPFQLSSFTDVSTFAAAQALAVSYRAICNAGLYIVVCGSLNYYTTYGHQYIIQNVKAEASKIGKSVGGLVPGGLGRVDAIWTLIPVFIGIPSP